MYCECCEVNLKANPKGTYCRKCLMEIEGIEDKDLINYCKKEFGLEFFI